MNKKKVLNTTKDFLIITFGAVLAAAAIYFFMLPSHVAVGSASALAGILSVLTSVAGIPEVGESNE